MQPDRRGAGARSATDVTVTGTVPDVRPYLQHAAVVVAPLRVARGIQNKILEAMAMARPVVATDACGAGIDAVNGRHFVTAHDAATMAGAVVSLLRTPAMAITLPIVPRWA